MLYELATLTCPLLSTTEAGAAAQAWVRGPDARGEVLGLWRTEIGTLTRLFLLRGFAAPEDMTAERRRALMSANPFNAGSLISAISMDSYAALPFLPPVEPGDRGGIYEFRTYLLRPGGLAPTIAGWQSALAPARDYTRHLVVALYALDGPVRLTHLWGFSSLEERSRLRTTAYAANVWPPPGAPEQIMEASSTIALPQPGSPLS